MPSALARKHTETKFLEKVGEPSSHENQCNFSKELVENSTIHLVGIALYGLFRISNTTRATHSGRSSRMNENRKM